MLTKVLIVKAMAIPVARYRCESWTIMKAECQGLVLLNCGAGKDSRVLWTARRSNESILKEINPECPLEEAETPIFGYLMQKADSLVETLVLGKIEGRRRRR